MCSFWRRKTELHGPAVWLFSLTGDVNNVWWCFPIAGIVSLIAGALFLRSALRDMEKSLSER